MEGDQTSITESGVSLAQEDRAPVPEVVEKPVVNGSHPQERTFVEHGQTQQEIQIDDAPISQVIKSVPTPYTPDTTSAKPITSKPTENDAQAQEPKSAALPTSTPESLVSTAVLGTAEACIGIQEAESHQVEIPPQATQCNKMIDVAKIRPATVKIDISPDPKKTSVCSSGIISPRNDAQLNGYPPDCGTKEYKYLSYAKVLRDRGLTHPMRYSNTEVDAVGNPKPEMYPLSTEFGAHSFHRLPTDSLVLTQYGIGMSLYFKFLKVMIWLFLLLIVLSIPSLVIYVIGGRNSMDEFQALAKQNLPAVLGMTSIGHLKSSSSACDQVLHGGTVQLTCPAGEIGYIKTVYSSHDTQGSCTCPEMNKIETKSGKCRGKPIACGPGQSCEWSCPRDGPGCFLGKHPISKWSCCAHDYEYTNKNQVVGNFSQLRIRSDPKCYSESMELIANGICLGKSSCSFNVSEEIVYKWQADDYYETYCPDDKKINGYHNSTGTTCTARINDISHYDSCPDQSKRGLIIFARCFTTRIDLSDEWSLQIVGWNSMSRKSFLGIAVGCDIACSLIFLLIIRWLRNKERQAIDRFSKDQIVVSDYTVQLLTIPRHRDVSKLKKELKAHLEQVLSESPKVAQDLDRVRIADIQFGRNNTGHLDILRNRGSIVRKLEVALQRLEKFKLLEGKLDHKTFDRRVQRHLKGTNKLDSKLNKYNKKLDRWNATNSKGKGSAVTAFITFEEEEGYNRCLTEYPDLGYIYRLFQPKRKRFHGKSLRFCPAPDPTDIVWENLRHGSGERFFRRSIVNLITISVLVVSFLLIFLAKKSKTELERSFGRPSSCPTIVTKMDVTQDEIAKLSSDLPYKSLVECYCKNALVTKSILEVMNEWFVSAENPNQRAAYCSLWARSFITAQGLSILAILIVVIINALLSQILQVLVALEKHHTESAQVVSRVTKVFMAQFCNTAILMVVINANLDYFVEDNQPISLSSFQIFNGKYSDFSPEWYSDVGVALMLTMVINAFVPHIWVLITYFKLEFQRFADRGYSFDYSITKQDTQRDLESLYRGPKFDLAIRYAQTLTIVSITYLVRQIL
jgi:hypothetical protein